MSYTPQELAVWVELIERREARERASLIETIGSAMGAGTKEGNAYIKDVTAKLRDLP